MPSAEEERAVFDDEDEDEDDDDSEMGDESEDEYDDDDDAAAAPRPQPQNPPPASDPNPNSSSSNPNPSASSSHPPAAPDPTPQNGAIQPVPVPLATAAPDSSSDLFGSSPDRKRQKILALEERRTPGGFDESRRLFQRLWTDEDEIVILKGFLEFTSQRGTTHANYQHDTGPFYEQIKTQLQLDFTKNQLIEKLRRLKKKYRNVVSRMNNSTKDFAFKSAHEKAIYEIARHIWSSTFKRPRNNRDGNFGNPQSSNFESGHNGGLESDQRVSRSSQRRIRKRFDEAQIPSSAAVEIPVMVTQTQTPTPSSSGPPIPSVIEETVKCCLSPLFKELLQYAINGPNGALGLASGGMLNPLAFSFGGSSMNLPQCSGTGAPVDEKWKKQQILELEVYLKRVELLQEQIKSTLEELRSTQTQS